MATFTVDYFCSLDGNGSAHGWPGYWGKEGPLVESTVLDGRTQKLVYIPHPHTGIPDGVGPQRRED